MKDRVPRSQEAPLPIWWLSPLAIICLSLIPLSLLAQLTPKSDYVEYWDTPKHLTASSGWMLFGTCVSLVVGILLANLCPHRGSRPIVWNLAGNDAALLRKVFFVSASLTICGYLVWAFVSVKSGVTPGMLVASLKGESGASFELRQAGETLPGVSTATQFGMVTMVLGAVLLQRFPSSSIRFTIGLILLLATIRAFVWSERLAVIELVVPLGVGLIAGWKRGSKGSLRRFLFTLGPVPLAGALYLVFTAAEYFRSWSVNTSGGTSIWYFSWMRLSGYYLTAVNNGALLYDELGHLPIPYFTLAWFWRFPLVAWGMPYTSLSRADPAAYEDALTLSANPEYTNGSGIFPYFSDYGVVIGLVFWIVFGFLIQRSYRAYLKGELSGMLVFPICTIGLLELARIPYLTSSRVFPSWLMIFVLLLFVRFRSWSKFQRRPFTQRPVAPSSSGGASPIP